MVGVHVEPGESPEQAARRECREEIAVDVLDLHSVEVNLDDPDLVAHAFLSRSWIGQPMNAAPYEHDAIRWFTCPELPQLRLAHPSYLQWLTGLLEQRGGLQPDGTGGVGRWPAATKPRRSSTPPMPYSTRLGLRASGTTIRLCLLRTSGTCLDLEQTPGAVVSELHLSTRWSCHGANVMSTGSGHLRTATAGDGMKLVNLWARLFDPGSTAHQQTWQSHALEWLGTNVDEPGAAWFPVVEVGGEVVACAIGTLELGVPNPYCLRGRTVRLANLVTMPAYRGQGFGTALVTDVLAWARSISADRVDLSATPEGLRIYEGLGFVMTSAPRMKLVL